MQFRISWLLLVLLFAAGGGWAQGQLLVSNAADRSNPSALAGALVSGNVYIFFEPDQAVTSVAFAIDGAQVSLERRGPYDLAGTLSNGLARPYDSSQLSAGAHTVTATVTLADGSTALLTATFDVDSGAPPPSGPTLVYSLSASRTPAAELAGASLSGLAYVYLETDVSVTEVRFYLDDPTFSGPPLQVERFAPYDLRGGGTLANPLDTSQLADGAHVLSARITTQAGSVIELAASFDVANGTGSVPTADQIHLSWVTDPATTLTVSWRTRLADTPSTVSLREAGTQPWSEYGGSKQPAGASGTLHEVTVSGLAPDRAYEYRVAGDNGVWSQSYQTRTGPGSGGVVRAAFLADTGISGRADGLATGTLGVRDAIRQLAPTLVLGGGDYAYFNTDTRFGSLDEAMDAWFNQMQPLAARSPLMPAIGNHEALLGEGYERWAERFATPVGFDDGRYYSFDVGEVHFVSVFAVEETAGLPQAALDWLTQDLTAARNAGARWIVPFFHVSPFADGTNHPSNLALRAQLGPLFEAAGVKVVLSAHDQAYERSFPLTDVPGSNLPTSTSLGCYEPGDGVSWVKVSPGGKLSNKNNGFSGFATTPAPTWTARRSNTRHHFALLTASSTRLAVDVYGVTGDGAPASLIDSFEVRDSCPDETPTGPSLRVSADPSRQPEAALEGSIVSGDAYVFVEPADGIAEALFWLDDPSRSGAPLQRERRAPLDMGGTAGSGLALPFDTTVLTDGLHNVSVDLSFSDGASGSLEAAFSVNNGSGNLLPTAAFSASCSGLSCTFDASASVDPDGTITDYAWTFGDGQGGSGVSTGHSFAGSGTYEVALTVTDNAGAAATRSEPVSVAAGGTGNNPPTASFTSSCSGLSCSFDARGSSDGDGVIDRYDWLFGDGGSATGALVSHSYGATGSYTVTLTAVDNDGAPGVATQTLNLGSGAGCAAISTLDCGQVRRVGDLELTFDGGAGGITDGAGQGTGFTMVDPPSFPGSATPDPSMPGHRPERLSVSGGQLEVLATPGIQFLDNNNLDNALGIGFNLPSSGLTVSTRLTETNELSVGGWAQAGLWFGAADNFGRGTTEDDYIKLALASPEPGVLQLQMAMEQDGAIVQLKNQELPFGVNAISLSLIINPVARTVQGRYDAGAGERVLTTFSGVPDEWFSFDQAGIDPDLNTRSMGGIYATQRRASSPVTVRFDSFSVLENTPVAGDAAFAFDRWSIPVDAPTSMAWGPDGRLYVTELFGDIHAFTLDRAGQTVVDDQVITALSNRYGGNRLTLGLAMDPDATADNVILWASHSDGSVNNGQENSGIVSRIAGARFDVVDSVITGLPRAIANHAINDIEFGPDDRLYIAAGGNTGAGAANLEPTEFGDRPEQPLSAAILAAAVKAPGFGGACATPVGQFGVPSGCDVEVFASGLRNSYDAVWHSNGELYATDNGLGILGTVPPRATPTCTAFGRAGIDDPGSQPDLLLRVLQGRYYGHPNPYRNECVFKDGSFQGAAPLPNYEGPMLVLGENLSANSILEYGSDAFYGKLQGQLLISNFSVGDNITRVVLADDGQRAVDFSSLAAGFTDPLPLAQDPAGNLYVGEFSANRITVLVPQPLDPAPGGGWVSVPPLPGEVLDAAGAAAGGAFYVIAGKNQSQHLSTVYEYSPTGASWRQVNSLPGPGVENPAATTVDERIYVFGGSTSPFSGALTNAAVYDPESDQWRSLPPMQTPRSGAAAVAKGELIYVLGGMDASGNSLSSVEIFDTRAESWSAGPPMQTRRDNLGAAVLGDAVYVFGGRTRNQGGTVVQGTLASVERLDPSGGGWSFRAPMPSARRAMAVGAIDGRAVVSGGEAPVVADVQEYDPASNSWRSLSSMATPRHGTANAVLGGRIYVVGGGTEAGSSFSSVAEFFFY